MATRRQQGEGSLFKRSRDGRWVATVDVGWKENGRRDRREFTGKTPEIALERRAQFLQLRREGFTSPRGRPLTVDEWMRHWLANIVKRRVEATTWERGYRQKVEELICPFFVKIPLPQLCEEDIERWHHYLERRVSPRTGRPVSASTIGQAHRIMSSAIREAVARGKLPRNPCSFVTPPRAQREEIMPPTVEELRVILARCGDWPNGVRWVVAIGTGLRQGEALALQWRDVKLDGEPQLAVRQSAAQIPSGRIVKPPKSPQSRRPVPLPGFVAVALRAHRKAQAQERMAAAQWEDHGLVFCREDGRPVHPRQDWQDWQDLLAELGIPHYRVHDLRHAYATMLMEAGEDTRIIQALMGHATPGFTQAFYQHVRPAMHDKARAMLDSIFGAG